MKVLEAHNLGSVITALLLLAGVTLSESLHLSKLQLLHWQNGDTTTYLAG